MWLNDRGLSIQCVRLIPYADGKRVLLDVQQVIPLPEAEAYQVRLREKSRKERESRQSNRDYTKFYVTIDGQRIGPLAKRETVYRVVRHLCDHGVSPEDIKQKVSFRKKNSFISVPGAITSEEAFVTAATNAAFADGRKFDLRRIKSMGRTSYRMAGARPIAVPQSLD